MLLQYIYPLYIYLLNVLLKLEKSNLDVFKCTDVS